MRANQSPVEFFTVKEVAEYTKLSISKVYQLIDSGKLRAHRIDRSVRISSTDFAQFIEDTRTLEREESPRRQQLNAAATPGGFQFIKINQVLDSKTSSSRR